jgi:integrase
MQGYLEAKRRLGQTERANEALTVLQRHLAPRLCDLPLSELTPELLKDWMARLMTAKRGEPPIAMSQGRVDKVRGVLRAALRQAKVPDAVVRDGLSAAAMPQRHAPATREAIPSRDQVNALIAAMQSIDADLALFIEVLALTGTRPSQLARCRTDDLDVANGLLTIPNSRKGRAGTRKNGRGITFPIGRELAGRLAGQQDKATGLLCHTARLVQDFSLVERERLAAGGVGDTWREAGRIAWAKDQWVRKVRQAVHAADLDPEITIYSLRHARVISLIQAGMALREIAGLLDTSAVMIERAYAKHIAATDATTARLRRVLEAEASDAVSPTQLRVLA